jgi:protein-tyrosine phosphatase
MIEAFRIASLPVGSGRLGICRLPGASGDLAGDVAAILAWKPTAVVSMTGMGEMRRLGAGALAEHLTSAGIAWRHLPIADFTAPGASGPPEWPELSAELHGALDAGGGVLLHCRAGLGRSGMVALRLLVERGEEPAAALTRIRAVRPGAVETEAQRAWAVSGRRG